MGTSASRNGPRPTTPLLPDWPGLPPLPPVPPIPPVPPVPNPLNPPLVPVAPPQQPAPVVPPQVPPSPANRYNTSRKAVKAYARSGGNDKDSLRKALREYVKTSGGGKRVLARRMYSSVQSVERLGGVLSSIAQTGVQPTLLALNLGAYAGAAALDVLSALIDAVAPATGQLDDALARQAYALMVERIDENLNISIDSLTQADVYEVLAIYIEETIVCRVINDIGATLMTEQHDPAVCADLIDDLYQIVNGAIHNDILAGLSSSNPQLPPNTGQVMEDIYQLALDALSNA